MIDNGGPAFPRQASEREGHAPPEYDAQEGMCLRDWLAGMALQGILYRNPYEFEYQNVRQDEPHGDWAARQAYGFADAMIAERKKGDGDE